MGEILEILRRKGYRIMQYHNRLTIILLIWTCVSATDLTHLRCPPSPTNCTIAFPTYWNNSIAYFGLDGNSTLTVEVKDSEIIQYFCTPGAQGNLARYFKSLPKFERVHHFAKARLLDCGLPQEPYQSIMDALNVTGLNDLTLVFNTYNQKYLLAPNLFSGLHDLLTLHVSCYLFKNASFDFDFLNQLQNLKNLELAGVTIPPFPSWNLLKSITVLSGAPLNMLQYWGGCQALEELKVKDWWYVTELPESWLAKCSRLASVHIDGFKMLKNLPQHMFNSIYIRTMKLINCHISDLPKDLFDHTKNLRLLDLSSNKLRWITSDVLKSIKFLETFILKDNQLKKHSINNFAVLKSLKTLILDGSFEVDTCDYQDQGVVKPQWPLLATLERLSLKESYVTKICSYWNESMPRLKHLNLANSLITELKYHDIELIYSNGWDVDLSRSKLQAIVFTKSDYEAVRNLSPTFSNSTIRRGRNFHGCDCRWYWFARIIKEYPGYVSVPDLLCDQQWGNSTNPVLLETMTLDSFICKMDNCEPGCHCFKRAPDNTSQINCTGAGLDHIPRVPLLRELHMPYNKIKTIHAYDLPETLEYMDLQNNQLSTLDMKIATKMFNRSKVIYNLVNNRLICDCSNNALIKLLQTHKYQLENYQLITCADGSPLHQANTLILCLKDHAPVIAGVLATIALLSFAGIIIYYRYKTQIYVIMYAWGWCACCVNEQELDKDKLYDIFISFAYEDTSLVMNEILPELEKEPHAFTVCVHHRDWIPGEWIPSQIAHSVQQSRRTIIVLSKNFLSSIWALLEFRTAHIQAMKDGRVRLIIVLLGDVISDEGMDDELRAYLSTNTYIKWGDSMFWDRLRYALPHRGSKDWREHRRRSAGEEVLRLARPTDPTFALRDIVPAHMLSIEPAQIEEVQL